MSENPKLIEKDCDLLKMLNVSNKDVSVVMFTAKWCGPCKKIKEKIKESFLDTAQFFYVDIDKCEKLADEYKIKSIPDFRFYKKGDKSLREGFTGIDSNKLKSNIEKLKGWKGDSESDSESNSDTDSESD